ncbi:zinc finger and SCAN domain-containing protein 12-like [Bombyx mori]
MNFIKCHYCPQKFKYHSQRKQHANREHCLSTPDKYACDHCGRQFNRKNALAEHMQAVHVKRKCLHCDMRFARRDYMFHMNEEHGVAMPTCGICGHRTLLQSALVRHQRNVHLKERDKQCSLCPKTFCTRSNLKEHMVSHEKERVHKCDVCSKSFARRGCFTTHYRIHTGERPFSCDVCKASFVQRASLRFHMRSRHLERP